MVAHRTNAREARADPGRSVRERQLVPSGRGSSNKNLVELKGGYSNCLLSRATYAERWRRESGEERALPLAGQAASVSSPRTRIGVLMVRVDPPTPQFPLHGVDRRRDRRRHLVRGHAARVALVRGPERPHPDHRRFRAVGSDRRSRPQEDGRGRLDASGDGSRGGATTKNARAGAGPFLSTHWVEGGWSGASPPLSRPSWRGCDPNLPRPRAGTAPSRSTAVTGGPT